MAYVTTPQFGNWFIDIAKSVVPSKTIVGKLLSGDTAGAIAGTQKLISGQPAKSWQAPAGSKPAPGGGPGLFDPGGFIAQN